MAYLVLNLKDLLITKLDSRINESHITTGNIGFYLDKNRNKVYFKFLNLYKTAELITAAYRENDGVIILSSGSYCRSIVSEIALHLSSVLPRDVLEKFQDCRFHSADTDARLFNVDKHTVAHTNKCDRLKQIVRHTPELDGKYFIVVDSNKRQVDTFENEERMAAVWAPTETEDKDFYSEASTMLHIAAVCEEDGLHLAKTTENVRKYINDKEQEQRKIEASLVKETPAKTAVVLTPIKAPEFKKVSPITPPKSITPSREPFKELLNVGALTFKPAKPNLLAEFDEAFTETENIEPNLDENPLVIRIAGH